ncbi:hypothetical protein KUTeg_006814 [Tegillarca granosa]|uniref:Uncharacterized protein n=1 Tax=Tegillarca granosa TaxID=220873 RepID=A0ABQ9FBE5_TEGGR|nr:hypothetical protein KUTeg_006814 [Tegillarca granosa]
MLHVTTEIGKVGRKEREKRHFPDIHNSASVPSYKPSGRRYIPHGYGNYDEWTPHQQNIQIAYSECGPDWKSRLKYIPDPENPKYPAMEIFPNNWHAMRPYPFTYMRTKNEWLLDPEFIIDKRNGIPSASLGDKSYQAVEYEPEFFKKGAALPPPQFGANFRKRKVDTFIPLQPLPVIKRDTYKDTEKKRVREEEINVVKNLDNWKPATPLHLTLPQEDPKKNLPTTGFKMDIM